MSEFEGPAEAIAWFTALSFTLGEYMCEQRRLMFLPLLCVFSLLSRGRERELWQARVDARACPHQHCRCNAPGMDRALLG